MNAGSSRRPDTDLLMVCIPNISTAKPIRISAICCMDFFLEIMRIRIPATAIIALRLSVESSFSAAEAPSPPTEERQMTQPVMLVPMIAPMIMEIACRRRIMEELTKPTTMTLVAEDD